MKLITICLEEMSAWSYAICAAIPGRVGRIIRRNMYGMFLSSGAGLTIDSSVVIAGMANITLGKNCSIGRNTSIFAREGKISIGNNFSINEGSTLGSDLSEIVIGDDVMIAQNVVLRSADHVFEDPNTPIKLQGHKTGKISVGDGAWIGANVVIVKGVSIGQHSVIGAGSVVTSDIPSMSVAAGVPGRVIKRRD